MRKIAFWFIFVISIAVVISVALYFKYVSEANPRAGGLTSNQQQLSFSSANATAIADVNAEKELPVILPGAAVDLRASANEVVFTIDDGPFRSINNGAGEHTAIILDILKRENVTATFFLLGCQLDTKFVSTGVTYQRYCEWVKRTFAEGHTVGIHDYNHIAYFKQSKSQLMDSFIYTRMRIKEVSGYDVSAYVRSPGGSISPDVADFLKENRYKHVFWNINPETRPHLSPSEILKNIEENISNGKRGIILMHDRTASGYLAELIKYLKSQRINIISLQEWETKYGLPDTVIVDQKETFK